MGSKPVDIGRTACDLHSVTRAPCHLPELRVTRESDTNTMPLRDLRVSFDYTCSVNQNTTSNPPRDFEIQKSGSLTRSSSFSCLSAAALCANVTLANTNILNGIIGEEILPSVDSPNSFRKIPSCSRLDSLSSSCMSESPSWSHSVSTDGELLEGSRHPWESTSATTNLESSSFLHSTDIKMAGGAAGEDRVQAVCSEENGWLYCGIYDGFNGRDAADFLAATLYENVAMNMQQSEWSIASTNSIPLDGIAKGTSFSTDELLTEFEPNKLAKTFDCISSESHDLGVLDCLTDALAHAEDEFMLMVEQEMEQRPDLVSIGTSVLSMLLCGNCLYVMNLGDSRAVLASKSTSSTDSLQAVQLTEIHSVDNELEHRRVLVDHPDDPSPIIDGRVKGKLKLTRALGVGYLKKKEMNDALMGILRVRNLSHPPYVYTDPFTMIRRVSDDDLFIVLGSDGLFDFFSNFEVVKLVHQFILEQPFGDPAKHLIELLILRAAERACFSREQLMKVPLGMRRKYHDDVTIIVIMLGNKQWTSTASTSL